jgi:phosphatidylserine/phosphatidylglycerophosphate/cardiolipin synthase-like enzyme
VLDVATLTDGGNRPEQVARVVAAFLDRARSSLDLAQYDFHLGAATCEIVCGAIKQAAARGVAVRILYNVEHPNPIPVPPPPEPDVALIRSLGVEAKAISGVPDLMHHKYAIRDWEAVLTGSANWTDDSWYRQENVLATVESQEVAAAYEFNFEELWRTEAVDESGFGEPRHVSVGPSRICAWFTPGHGEELSSRVGAAIRQARRRVRICSPVITAAEVLGGLAQNVSEGRADVAGCVDATQVDQVIAQWSENGNVSWKLPLLRRALALGFSGKPSTPWSPTSVHDYMHAKVTIADDIVFLGSFNLSRSGEENAENMLEIRDRILAGRLAAYVDTVRARYPALDLSLPEGNSP